MLAVISGDYETAIGHMQAALKVRMRLLRSLALWQPLLATKWTIPSTDGGWLD